MSDLVARSLTQRVGDRTLFSDVDLTVRAGQVVAVTGPSGSGKTSLLALLSGLERPGAGSVELDGTPVTDPALRTRIAVLLQGYGLVAVLTATENVEIALRGTGTRPREARTRAEDLLSRLDLAEHRGRLLEELSGGQQQRVALARALAGHPDVLVADEPTAEQDGAHRAVVLEAIRGAADAGAAVVIATHDPEVSAGCDAELRL